MLSLIGRNSLQWSSKRTITSIVSSFSPISSLPQPGSSNLTFRPSAFASIGVPVVSTLLGFTQRRWKSRGNTFQPSTLKRKRRVGFLARARSRTGQNILKRRRDKGRWYLTY
ncbi:HBR022Wp [Eremothecium sinecaudum]|uniref:Large ribosomal subunit protein bL34m n=1 Tax=Eremothecium sinecaudum TaxID=45286 RepID=A0A109UWT2_9SACH|nr:HBR022Wp [Eremothecium sinecaudum]AMD18923.1 HBR022Wp [Eremothecium sinecaudum]